MYLKVLDYYINPLFYKLQQYTKVYANEFATYKVSEQVCTYRYMGAPEVYYDFYSFFRFLKVVE